MKFNAMKVVTEFTTEFNKYLEGIKNADDYDKAKRRACGAIGFIDGLRTLTNAMICMENNDFTSQMDAVEDEWYGHVYNALANAALKFNKDAETVCEYLRKRDEAYESARED